MKPDKQNIAIAQACGWRNCCHVTNATDGCNGLSPSGTYKVLPDYLVDLNAMHEAEKFIRKDHDVYGMYLQHLNRTAPECRVHATAAQKAEAFLRAIGKWEEDK